MPVSQTFLLQFVISFMDGEGKHNQGLVRKSSASAALQSRGSGRSAQVTNTPQGSIRGRLIRRSRAAVPPPHTGRNPLPTEHLLQPAVHTGIMFTGRL